MHGSYLGLMMVWHLFVLSTVAAAARSEIRGAVHERDISTCERTRMYAVLRWSRIVPLIESSDCFQSIKYQNYTATSNPENHEYTKSSPLRFYPRSDSKLRHVLTPLLIADITARSSEHLLTRLYRCALPYVITP